MKVALVSEHASPLATVGGVDAGGQNVHVATLARELSAGGDAVTVYTRRDHPALPRSATLCPGVEVVHVEAGPARELPKDELLPHMPAFSSGLLAHWGRDRPDIVHAHFWMSTLASVQAARPLGIPVLVTFHALGSVKRRHQGSADTSPPQRVDVESRLTRQVDAILATCRDEVEELRALGAPAGRVAVVPCGIDLRHFCPRGPAEPRRPRIRRVVSLGRLVPRKGLEEAVEAVAAIPGVELVIAGGPDRALLGADPEARRLEALARELGCADRVELRGRVDRDDVPALLRSADAVVAVPRYEPFGIVPLEAMACGVPVIGSAVGGLLDTVVHGGTGLLVPPGRPERVREALLRVLADEPLRRRVGAAGTRRARRYGCAAVVTRTRQVYAAVAGGRVSAAVAETA